MFQSRILTVCIFIGVLLLAVNGLLAETTQWLNYTPYTIDFGIVTLGETFQLPVEVTPSNPYAVPPQGIQLISTSGEGFSYDYISVPYTFVAGTPLTINVNFSSTNPGLYAGQLIFVDLDSNQYAIPLNAQILYPEAKLLIVDNPLNLDFEEGSIGHGYPLFYNLGATDLIFTIPEDSLPSWISFTGTPQGKSGDVSRVGPTTVLPGEVISIPTYFNLVGVIPGDYTHTINVSTNDPVASSIPWEINVLVTPLPLVTEFSADPVDGNLTTTITFVDESRLDPDMPDLEIVAWQWDFDGNGTIDSYEQFTEHVYSATGVFSPSLRVTANTGYSSFQQRIDYITITNQPPVAYAPIDTLYIYEDEYRGPISIFDHFVDPDEDWLEFTATDSPHISISTEGSSFYVVPQANWTGVENISISVTDGHSPPLVNVIEVSVFPKNDPPTLSVPADMYFIRNAPYVVDFGEYINDMDTPLSQIAIFLDRLLAQTGVNYTYTANTPGALTATFTNATGMWNIQNSFVLTVIDDYIMDPTTQNFNMHVLEHFNAQFTADLGVTLAGQSIQFTDLTLGNPNWWQWDFDNDGITDSQEQNPVHAYQYAGTYSVRLTLGNSLANEQSSYLWTDMFTMQGTAVPEDAVLPPTMQIEGSPYNIVGDFTIPTGGTTINPGVVLNFLVSTPVNLDGSIFANGVSFQAPNGGTWGGFIFSPGSEGGSFTGCRIIDAVNPLMLDGFVPTIVDSLVIATSDTTQFFDSPGITMSGANPHLQNVSVYNYRGGIKVDNQSRTATTPTLTNIRVRNSSESSRVDSNNTGIFLDGEIDGTLDDIEIINCSTGIKFVNDSRAATTPTLTNIRIRNSSESSRGIYKGIVVEGAVAPSMSDIDIAFVQMGIDLRPNVSDVRATPTLTNIRVRNSSESSRTESTGIKISNLSTITLSDIETNDLTTGIEISQSNRSASTPTLTNIRVRNSSESSRATDYGIKITGDVNASLNDIITEECSYGIVYDMSGVENRLAATPTLTNIRVRNSSESSRGEVFGFILTDLGSVKLVNDSLGNCTQAIQILNTRRALSTPTLTNIRVRNSSETQRNENIGIRLSRGVAGRIQNCDIDGALIGIQMENGCVTELGPNLITNCGTGIKAWAAEEFQIDHQTIALDSAFAMLHSTWSFNALDLNYAGPFKVENNTIMNYPCLVKATHADVGFTSNIGWANDLIMNPFQLISSDIYTMYNDVYADQSLFGTGDINSNPLFIDPALNNFNLSYSSPCIDAGSPYLPLDADGTVSDIGAWCYQHKASFRSDVRFIQTGTTVFFTNTSIGHEVDQVSSVSWDLNNDGIDSTSRNWTHTFTQPGLYNLKLTMQTGPLMDEIHVLRAIVVQDILLQPPVINEVTVTGDNIGISWQPVTQTIDNQPTVVDYYLLYSCDTPDGIYGYLGFTESPVTSFEDAHGAAKPQQFYIALGYNGTRVELDNFIRLNKYLGADGRKIGLREAGK